MHVLKRYLYSDMGEVNFSDIDIVPATNPVHLHDPRFVQYMRRYKVAAVIFEHRPLKELVYVLHHYHEALPNDITIHVFHGTSNRQYLPDIESYETAYITDVPNKDSSGNLDGSMLGTLTVVFKNNKGQQVVLIKDAGIVDYKKGEVILNTINITSTISQNNIIEVQAFPESNDVVGLKDLYLSFDVSNTTINMNKDVIASGEDVSGIVFTRDYYTSSYSNGDLERK